MTATATSSAWLARAQKRQHGELGMFRRPSESTSTHSSHSTITSGTFYTEPMETAQATLHSSVSSTNSNIPENFESLQALQLQLQKNNAQIAENEKRMREIMRWDDERGEQLSKHLAEVSKINRQLDVLTVMFARADQAGHGDCHAGLSQ